MPGLALRAVCTGCGRQGRIPGEGKPRWCRCKSERGGPFRAPDGYVASWTYDTKDEAAFREACRLAGNAEIQALQAMQEAAHYYPSGRKRSPSDPLYRRAVRDYRKAVRARQVLQEACGHPSRSAYSRVHCGVCYAHVECDVAHYRHLVREIGKARAMRLAV